MQLLIKKKKKCIEEKVSMDNYHYDFDWFQNQYNLSSICNQIDVVDSMKQNLIIFIMNVVMSCLF